MYVDCTCRLYMYVDCSHRKRYITFSMLWERGRGKLQHSPTVLLVSHCIKSLAPVDHTPCPSGPHPHTQQHVLIITYGTPHAVCLQMVSSPDPLSSTHPPYLHILTEVVPSQGQEGAGPVQPSPPASRTPQSSGSSAFYSPGTSQTQSLLPS